MKLVVGATGFLGSEICKRLRANGETVRAFVRPGAKREQELVDLGVEIAHGDLKDPPSVEAACQGARSIISTATCIMSRRSGDSLETVDRDGLLNLIDTAKRAGVKYFQFMSGTPNFRPSSPFGRYKREVEHAARNSGMAWNVLQPGAFMETAFSPMAGWNLKEGRIRIAGPGTTLASFISLYDVAEFSVAVDRDLSLHDRDLPLGGPEALSTVDAIKVFEQALGRPLKVSHVPIVALKTMKVLVQPFNPYLSSILDLMTWNKDDVIDMTETAKLIPNKLTSIEDHAKRAVAPLGQSHDVSQS
jgi:uncharacterized protein YbjT (DUF2867 family)